MHRAIFAAVVITLVLPSAPSLAVTAKDKMATCKFGADDQKLQGAARTTFIKRCMMDKNDPRGPAPMPAGGGMAPPPKN